MYTQPVKYVFCREQLKKKGPIKLKTNKQQQLTKQTNKREEYKVTLLFYFTPQKKKQTNKQQKQKIKNKHACIIYTWTF